MAGRRLPRGPDGHTTTRSKAESSTQGNDWFQDVLPVPSSDGVPRGTLPFPPLPALVLVPFVAIFGLATDDQTLFTVLVGASTSDSAWWMLGRLGGLASWSSLATTILFAFGTVLLVQRPAGTTWYFAHIVAVGLLMLAVGAGAAGRSARRRDDEEPEVDDAADAVIGAGRSRRQPRAAARAIDRAPARRRASSSGWRATARLTVVFGRAVLHARGRRRIVAAPALGSAGLGAAIPVGALLAYNVATTGQVFHPGYD